MIYWLYIVIAAVFEACWIYSLKFLSMKAIGNIQFATLFTGIEPWKPILPLLGYIAFGLCNIYFFSMAMKGIPASTAFAVWMGLALIFSKMSDVFIFNEAYNMQQVLFTGVLLVGIIGLKYYTKS
jgi:quaternary ammonium compound-resistance protein SugE